MTISFDPTIGEQRPAAWLAAADILRDLSWHSRGELVPPMTKASAMQAKSCYGLLEQARRSGLVDRTTLAGMKCYKIPAHRAAEAERIRLVLISSQVEAAAETEVLK